METLKEKYERLLQTETDIQAHLPDLFRLANQCQHVTEMGVRHGTSTATLYYGLFIAHSPASPRELVCYDKSYCECEKEYANWALQEGWPRYKFYMANTLELVIAETDLLFIDTLHTYDQLKSELTLHSGKVRRWIALHDTESFGERGEDGGPGLWPAITEFLEQGTFQLEEVHENQNGFVVLARK